MKYKLAGNNGYFVINQESRQWCGVKNGKLYYQAQVIKGDDGGQEVIKIQNFQYGYTAELQLMINPGDDQGNNISINSL
jgi:hypothetical protein